MAASTEILERPSALAVIGLLAIVSSALSLFSLAWSAIQLDAVRGLGTVDESVLSAEAALGGQGLLAGVSLIAGVGLLRHAAWAKAVFIASWLASVAIGAATSANLFYVAPSLMVAVALFWRFYLIKDAPRRDEANLALLALALVFLGLASFCVLLAAGGGVFMASLPVDRASEDVELAAEGLGFVAAGLFGGALFWTIGAALFRFRWAPATLGWVLMSAALLGALSAINFYAVAVDPALAQVMPPDFTATMALVNWPVAAALISGLAFFGAGLIAVQRVQEARRRAAAAASAAETFR